MAQWRAAFDATGDQEAARLARALGIDGTAVLAGVCDPTGGDEALLRRMHKLQAEYYKRWQNGDLTYDVGNATGMGGVIGGVKRRQEGW